MGAFKHPPGQTRSGSCHPSPLHTLANGYGSDRWRTRCVTTRAFHRSLRVNPDGAELAVADRPWFVRSSARSYPPDAETLLGHVGGDVDGDGHLRVIRVRDKIGSWRVCMDQPRVLLRRDAVEVGGECFRVFAKGCVHDHDGVTIGLAPLRGGLDRNRTFRHCGDLDRSEATRRPIQALSLKWLPSSSLCRHNRTSALSLHAIPIVGLSAGRSVARVMRGSWWRFFGLTRTVEQKALNARSIPQSRPVTITGTTRGK